jgi:DNA repair protein RadA/Sms
MNPPKTIFVCSKCDAQSPKWSGRCLNCGAWGTIKEEIGESTKFQAPSTKFDQAKLVDFEKIESKNFTRLKTEIKEIDNLLGGGIVKGSLILLGGEPGIGKSTIVLQILKNLENLNLPLLYVSGEESAEQVKLRADRLTYQPRNMKFLAETKIEEIVAALESLQPGLAIIDSIQTMYSAAEETAAGAVNQIRATTVKLLESAKAHHIPIIITGHVTKDGAVAGPKTLEHLVDVVLYLEGDKYHGLRVLRSAKNRFGSTNEIGLFEMAGDGLREVLNPSAAFLGGDRGSMSGSVISCFCEGARAFLVEIQALVTPTVFGYPLRKASGFDQNRLQLLAAVIAKRSGLNLNNQDIHLNVVGGYRAEEPALDLAVCAAIISGLKNIPLDAGTMIVGEVGLNGEVRPVPQLEKRLAEAEKLKLAAAIIPDVPLSQKFNLKITKIKKLTDLPLTYHAT